MIMGKSTIRSRSIGTFTLDTTTSEQHESKLKITDNPIESGAVISDHAVLEPAVITISGVLVEYEPASQDSIVNRITSALDRVNVSFVSRTSQTIRMQEAKLKSYIQPIANIAKQANSIASWLTGESETQADESSRLSRLYEDLLMLQKKGETIEVQTGIKLYQNMLIESISALTTYDPYLELMLVLREVHIVETKKTSGVQNPAGRSSSQARPKTQLGKTQPSAQSGTDASGKANRSIALEMLGGSGHKRKK